MGYSLQVFLSSACYELRDLRSAVQSWLKSLGLSPMLSNDNGFPHYAGLPPYASCLQVLEECTLVIGVIERQYGHPFNDWGPYGQYLGLSPTHAELRHSLELGKRLLLYVNHETLAFYEIWRNNKANFENLNPPKNLEVDTLQMLEELKTRKPAPWISRFSDVSDLLESLKQELVNQLYDHLRDREKQAADSANYLLEKITEAAPEVRLKIEAGLNPELVTEIEKLRSKQSLIQEELNRSKDNKGKEFEELQNSKKEVEDRLSAVSSQLDHTRFLLAKSVMKDVSWLSFIRQTMMTSQPGRVPFYNSQEVALRGYHAAAGAQRVVPLLNEVTWSLVPYEENGLHRGYNAAIIFKGSDFVPGVVYRYRRQEESDSSIGSNESLWHLPSIYFGNYLEVSSGDNEPEAALSWRGYEFQVRNPEGQTSDWVPFTYSFDDATLEKIRTESLDLGNELLKKGNPAEAVEPLRKAYVFSDRILGISSEETVKIKALWSQSLDEAALSKLRFRIGDELKIVKGPHTGTSGIVDKLLLRHLPAYVIRPLHGEEVQASDEQVERN